jgi:transposase
MAFPTPQALAEASERTLYAFLKGHRIGLSPKWQERVAARGEATSWPSDPAVQAVMPLRVHALVALLRTLKTQLDELRRRIRAAYRDHPAGALFASLPRSGEKLGPRLLGHFGTQPGRYESARSVQQLAGCVPVTRQSGKSKKVYFRRACQKRFRNALHQYALSSLQGSAWARACYDLACERGQSNAQALRAVGARWIKIIYRMWITHTPYDEAVYLASLIRHGSPIIAWMQSHKNPTESEKNP